MFSQHLRRRCIALYGIDPDVSYESFLEEIREGGGMSERLLKNLQGVGDITRAEREVVTLLCLGYSRHEIAALRVVTEDTVMKQVAKAKLRTGARTSAHLAAIAVARGLV